MLKSIFSIFMHTFPKLWKHVFAMSICCIVSLHMNAQSITVTSPNGAEKLYTGKTHSIKWTSSGISSGFVKLEYSIDSGSTWLLIHNGVNNTGTYSWNIPAGNTGTNCLLKISDFSNPDIYDLSNAVFSIQQPFITITSPNGGETLTGCTTHKITWDFGGVNSYVKIYYSINGNSNWIHVNDVYVGNNTKSYNWAVPNISSNDVRIKIVDQDNVTLEDISDAVFNISQTANSLTLTSPNGGESWSSSSGKTITWTTTGTVGNVSLQYSKDNGVTWSWISNGSNASNIPNTGSYNWILPSNINSENCMVRIYENSKSCNTDFSDNLFRIDNNPAISVIYPNKGEKLYVGRNYTLNWTASNLPTNYVKIEFSIDNGNNWSTITSSTVNDGSQSWNIPNEPSSQCLLKVSATDNAAIYDISDQLFQIALQTITVKTPNGGESLVGCTSYQITWDQEGVESYVSLFYSLDEGKNWLYIGDDYIADNSNSYNWSVPSINTTDLRIKVAAAYYTSVYDSSNATASINQSANNITLTSPNGGEVLASSSNHEITWTNSGPVGNISIKYSINGGQTWEWVRDNSNTIASNKPNTGSFNWLVPANIITSKALIQIYDHSKNCVVDVSEANFNINNDPVITITRPNSGEILYGGRTYRIYWSSSNLPGNYVKVEYSADSGATWNTIDNNRYNYGYIDWTVPKVYSDTYLIKITSNTDNSIVGISKAVFPVAPQQITLLTPNGGENLNGCSTYKITWNQTGVSNYVNLYYSINEGKNWVYITEDYIADNSNYYNWPVPSINASKVYIKVVSRDDASIYDSSDVSAIIIPSENQLTLTSPNGDEVLASSSNHEITWTTTGTVGNISIKYSTNGGLTWEWARDNNNTTANNKANTGSFNWLIPSNLITSKALIQIYEYSKNCISDVSDNNFSINNDPVITITSPDAGEKVYGGRSYRINWSSSNLPGNYVKVEYSADSGATWNSMDNNRYNYGYIDWSVPKVYSNQYIIKVTSVSDTSISDLSNVFSVVPQQITVLTPNGGESLPACGTYRITWSEEGAGNYAKIYYSTDGGNIWYYITEDYIGNNSHYYDWKIPSVTSSTLKIKVSSSNDPLVGDSSDNVFSINQGINVLTLTAPNGGENWSSSSIQKISWTTEGSVEKVSLKYSKDGGNTWEWVRNTSGNNANNISNTGSFDWLIPSNTKASNCLIQIYDYSQNCIIDHSDNYFTLNNDPTITIIMPNESDVLYAGSSKRIEWSSSNLPGNYMKLEYSIDSGATWNSIINSTYNYGYYNWTVPDLRSQKAFIKITSNSDNSINDVSNEVFSIASPIVKVTNPNNGNENWLVGENKSITWTSAGLSTSALVRIEYSANNGLSWTLIKDSVSNSGSYIWTIPNLSTSSQSFIKIRSLIYPECVDSNDIAFTITKPIVGITVPNDGQIWYIGESKSIQWSGMGTSGNVKIELSSDSAKTYNTIVASAPNTGQYFWTIPYTVIPSSKTYIKISDINDPTYYDTTDIAFTIAKPSLTLTSPKGTDSWYLGQTQKITWNNIGLSASKIKIEYSADSGSTWAVAALANNTGSYDWTIPSTITPSATAYIKISDENDASIKDSNDISFKMVKPSVTITSPNGGETLYLGQTKIITWKKDGAYSANVRIDYSSDSGATWNPVIASIANTGTYAWLIATSLTPGNNYLLRIRDAADSSIVDYSNAVFKVSKPTITVTYPNGGQTLYISETRNIQWQSAALTSSRLVKIELSTDNGTSWTIVHEGVGNNGIYSWKPENIPAGNQNLIKISDVIDPTIFDISNAAFTIASPSIVVTSPNGGEKWYQGQVKAIKWNSTALVSTSNVKIEYTINNSNTWNSITNLTANKGTYDWTIPTNINSDSIKVKVTSISFPAASDISNASFSVRLPRPGDNFETAIPITSIPNTITDTTTLYSDQFTGAGNQPSGDVFYSFTIPANTDSVSFAINANFPAVLHILKDKNTILHTSQSGYNFIAGTKALQSENTYYVVVEGNNTSSGIFKLSITNHNPPSDLAVQAVSCNKTEIAPKDEVTVTWNVKNIGVAAATVNWTERIFVQSATGTNKTLIKQSIYKNTDSIIYNQQIERSVDLTMPSNLNVGNQGVFVVEIIPAPVIQEPKGGTANNSSVQSTPWTIRKAILLELSANEITEGSTTKITAKVTRTGDLTDSLSLTINMTNNNRFTIPGSLVIPAGQAGTTFILTAPNNDIIEGNLKDTIVITAVGYPNAKAGITLIDNDKPVLTFSQLPSEAMEGTSVSFRVNTNLLPVQPLEVFLTSKNSKRLPLPASVTIPAGSLFADITILLEQDNIPEVDLMVEVIAGAANHVSAQGAITIKDDDIPGLELVLESNTVSESNGAFATKATIRRADPNNNMAFTVRLTTSIPNSLILPASITLNENELGKTFTVGVIDNNMVDGQRKVMINASIFVNSCGCSAPPTSSGSVSAELTINDNDGPALSITASRLTLPEGYANAGTIRVSRNTATDSELGVTLSSSDTTEAKIPLTAVIPVGKAFVDVPVTTINDELSDGNQQVYFYASSSGFASGSVWVMVSDQNKPDLQIADVIISKDKVQAMDLFNYNVSITNSGFATAPKGVLVRGYLSKDNKMDDSDSLISEDVLVTPIASGDTVHLINAIQAPNTPGNFKLIYKVNPELTLTELLLINNESKPVNISIQPDYTATANVENEYYFKGKPVPVTGNAVKHTGAIAANVKVEVYVITNGLRRTVTATTDETGKYQTEFIPLANESGYYTIGASFPGMGATEAMDNFNILGVQINNNKLLQLKTVLNDTLRGSIQVKNLSNKSLKDFTLAPATLPDGAIIQFDTTEILAANSTTTLNYLVVGTSISPGTNFEVAGLEAVSEEGKIQNTDVFYFCQAPNALLVSDLNKINITASTSKGERLVELKIANKGKGATGNISTNLPQVNWLKAVTESTLPSLASGDTTTVILKFLALDEVPFNYPIKGNVVIKCQNGNSLNIPFSFEKVSESNGTIKVQVTNQFTYYTEDAPKVKGALVKIKNYFTNVVYAEGYTDSTGIFTSTDIPEGKHRITIEKEKHLNYNNTVTISPNALTETSVFLNYQAITFNWSVVPTAIEDEYEITLVAQFETHVPMPVVTIDMPKSMPQLSGDEVYAFNVTLTNHGLITAKDVALNLPTTDPEYEFITNYQPADLIAQQSIQVPTIMRRRTSPLKVDPSLIGTPSFTSMSDFLGVDKSPLRTMAGEGQNCTGYASTVYWYTCNFSTGLWEKGAAMFSFEGRTCVSSGKGNVGISIPPNMWYPTCASCPEIPLNPATKTPVYETEKKSCAQCIVDILKATATCTGMSTASSIGCVASAVMSGGGITKLLPCIPGLIPSPIKCTRSVAKAITTCLSTSSSSSGSSGNSRGLRLAEIQSAKATNSGLGNVFGQIAENFQIVIDAHETRENWAKEYFGEMIYVDAWTDLKPQVEPYMVKLDSIPTSIHATILSNMEGYEIPPSVIKAFLNRWNLSISALKNNVMEPNQEYPLIINWNLVVAYSDSIEAANEKAISLGFSSLDKMYEETQTSLDILLDNQSQAVCASVKVQLNQNLTMTREAFEGTLEIFNGHPTDKMDSLSVIITVTDKDGVPSNGLFEIQTSSLNNLSDVTGTGKISAQQKGLVKFLFIPELGAAPEFPKEYNFGGYVRYWDPYANAMVNLPLSAVPLTVNPSPNLMLHYFLERNILGDDPFTKNEIEPSVPAELAVMVENHGYGPAVNMVISSAQPEIIENEKGLAIDFKLIGSNFQGQPKNLGVTDINFGTIPGLQTRIGQWYLTSSLLGKFISYEASVVHSNSFGNPELSLVKGVRLHELTKSIKAYGAENDGINDFLVNDVFDVNDRPDIIYFSQGNRTSKVYMASSGSFSSPVSAPTFTNTLTVTASEIGWNYIKLNDPGSKRYELHSVTRSDGQVIPLDNAWLTFVTLPAGKEPVYENKFHFIDTFSTYNPVTYTLVWKPKNTDVPKILSIEGAPESTSPVQVQSLIVKFSKNIDASTFGIEDITLRFQGGENIINNTALINQIDSVTFSVDISNLTTGNGFYNFTIQAAGIKDIYGISGETGKNITWTQMLTVPSVQAFYGLPQGNKANAFDTIQVLFNLPIDLATVTADRFIISKDSVVQNGTIIIDSIRADKKLFYLSGLKDLLTETGVYEFKVDLPNIKSIDQVAGIKEQSILLTLDNKGQEIINLSTSTAGGMDNQHVNSIHIDFNENVKGLNIASIQLSRNGEVIFLKIDQLSNTDLRTWMIENLGMLTYAEGDYKFTVNLAGFTDAIGNSGNGTKEITWTVDRTTVVNISNLSISPDKGYSDNDGITSGLNLNVSFDLSSDAEQITILQTDALSETVLKTISGATKGTNSYPVTLLAGGATGIKVISTGVNGAEAIATKSLFVDQTALKAQWLMNDQQVRTIQPDSVQIKFSSRLLSTDELLDAIQFSRNGLQLPVENLTYKKVNDTVFTIYGFKVISNLSGSYQLSLNLETLSKYSSGINGMDVPVVSWTVQSNNTAPVANAGKDIVIAIPGEVILDASASYDPDADPITFHWVVPPGVELNDTTLSSPSFTITEANDKNTYSFLLIVKDGSLFSTDIVNVKVSLTGERKYYKDEDKDGYGDNEYFIISDVGVDGYVLQPGDCNDADASINPNAVEVRDGIDNDCDGEIDEDYINSINENINQVFNISVYPVPTNDQFTIVLEGLVNSEYAVIKIYNDLGIMIDEINDIVPGQNIVTGESYTKGIYVLEVVVGGKRKSVKIIKQ